MAEDHNPIAQAQSEIDEQDRQAALGRIRQRANLSERADSGIYDTYSRIVSAEIQAHGVSESERRWHNRRNDEKAWNEVEQFVAVTAQKEAERWREPYRSPCQKIPEDILNGRHPSELTEAEMDRARVAMQRENDQREAREYRKSRGIPED